MITAEYPPNASGADLSCCPADDSRRISLIDAVFENRLRACSIALLPALTGKVMGCGPYRCWWRPNYWAPGPFAFYGAILRLAMGLASLAPVASLVRRARGPSLGGRLVTSTSLEHGLSLVVHKGVRPCLVTTQTGQVRFRSNPVTSKSPSAKCMSATGVMAISLVAPSIIPCGATRLFGSTGGP
jgi:hypothetical protein